MCPQSSLMERLVAWADGSVVMTVSALSETCLEDCFRKAPISDFSAMCGTNDHDASMINDIGYK